MTRVPDEDRYLLTAALAAARLGEDAGFPTVYRALQPSLLRYLAGLLDTDAEDVASETISGRPAAGLGFRRHRNGVSAVGRPV